MLSPLEQAIEQTKGQNRTVFSVLRELAWCEELTVVCFSGTEGIYRLCVFENAATYRNFLEKNPDAMSAEDAMPMVLSNMMGYSLFLRFRQHQQCAPQLNLELYTARMSIGFQQMSARCFFIIVSSIQLESELMQWQQRKKPNTQDVFRTFHQHELLLCPLVPASMYELGDDDTQMPMLLETEEQGETLRSIALFTAHDRKETAWEGLRRSVRPGYQIQEFQLAGEKMMKSLHQQTRLFRITDGILWNPFTKAQFFLSWNEFLSWFPEA